MKTLADLKRTIKPGTRLHVVQHDYRPELVGSVRTVTDVQGNGYFFTTDSDPRRAFSPYFKASCYSFPEPNTYRQDQGVHCSCCSSAHSLTCNVTTGKRQAWTMQILSEPPERSPIGCGGGY